MQWRSAAPTEIVEVSPAVAPDGTVVVGTNDPYELDPTDGSVLLQRADLHVGAGRSIHQVED